MIKYPKDKNEFPADEMLYAFLVPRRTYIPGDERSRTHPGHGYPEHTERSWDVIICEDREEWMSEIKKRMSRRFEQGFPITMWKPTVKTNVSVSVSLNATGVEI
jgi:hypothetical protein